MVVLQLAPLCRGLRLAVEEGRMVLGESTELLDDASFLVLAKVRWLLPQSVLGSVEDPDGAEEDENLELADFQERVGLLEESEFSLAISKIEALLNQTLEAFCRGYTVPIEGTGQVETASVDVRDLFDAMISLEKRLKPEDRAEVVLRRSFSAHMRWFLKEINKLSLKYTVLRFSLFMSSRRPDSILNFLVLLELVKRRRVFARQHSMFDDIVFSTKRDIVEKGM